MHPQPPGRILITLENGKAIPSRTIPLSVGPHACLDTPLRGGVPFQVGSKDQPKQSRTRDYIQLFEESFVSNPQLSSIGRLLGRLPSKRGCKECLISLTYDIVDSKKRLYDQPSSVFNAK